MKKQVYILVLCTLALCAFFGCKEKNKPESFLSDKARPTWTAPSDYDYTSSMTAVIQVDLAAQYPDIAKDFILNDNDLLAAFSGETCLGTASPLDDLFFLYIASPSSLQGEDGGRLVTLRYYSAHYKNLFEAKDAFPYVSDSNQGSVDTPFLPAFVVVK